MSVPVTDWRQPITRAQFVRFALCYAAVMSRCYRRLAKEYDALLAPVGEVFEALRGAGIPLYWRDGEHASPYGAFAAAACFAGLLTGSRELGKLSDRGFDFRPDFGEKEEDLPVALEDPAVLLRMKTCARP